MTDATMTREELVQLGMLQNKFERACSQARKSLVKINPLLQEIVRFGYDPFFDEVYAVIEDYDKGPMKIPNMTGFSADLLTLSFEELENRVNKKLELKEKERQKKEETIKNEKFKELKELVEKNPGI